MLASVILYRIHEDDFHIFITMSMSQYFPDINFARFLHTLQIIFFFFCR